MRAEATAWTARVAVLVGAIDASVSVAYALGVAPDTWHVGTLVAKIALVALVGFPGRALLARNAGLLLLMALAIGVGSVNPMTSLAGLAAALGFLAHLVLTLALLEAGRTRSYLSGMAGVIGVAMAAYLVFRVAGAVPVRYGRWLYFGGAHPNLGAEIAACGTVAAALALRWRGAMAVGLVALGAASLMEGRAAILAIGMAVGVRSLFALSHRVGRRGAFALIAVAGPPLAFLIWGPTARIGTHLLLLDDPARGLGTGFVGRDERWSAAWRLVAERPLFGNGIGYFDGPGALESPHNFALYALAEYGVPLGGAVLVALGLKLWRIAHHDPGRAAVVASLLPMLVFNDRFINLNPYPFMVFVVLCGFAAEMHHRARAPRDAPGVVVPA